MKTFVEYVENSRRLSRENANRACQVQNSKNIRTRSLKKIANRKRSETGYFDRSKRSTSRFVKCCAILWVVSVLCWWGVFSGLSHYLGGI